MSWIMVDVESDGPIPGVDDFSMVELGAMVVEPEPPTGFRSFYGQLKPISDNWDTEALGVTGYTREQTEDFPPADYTIQRFSDWVLENSRGTGGRHFFISDNNGYDFQFVNWYFIHFLGDNPFGHTSTNMGDLYKGLVKNTRKNFKHLRKTRHTHHPVDDCKGNVEALLHMRDEMGLNITLE